MSLNIDDLKAAVDEQHARELETLARIYERSKKKAGRPTKQPGEKMNVPLKIMLTATQMELIREASGGEMSEWARAILLEAALAAEVQ